MILNASADWSKGELNVRGDMVEHFWTPDIIIHDLVSFYKPEIMNQVAALEVKRSHQLYYKVRCVSWALVSSTLHDFYVTSSWATATVKVGKYVPLYTTERNRDRVSRFLNRWNFWKSQPTSSKIFLLWIHCSTKIPTGVEADTRMKSPMQKFAWRSMKKRVSWI